MSATLDASAFANYFGGTKIVYIQVMPLLLATCIVCKAYVLGSKLLQLTHSGIVATEANLYCLVMLT